MMLAAAFWPFKISLVRQSGIPIRTLLFGVNLGYNVTWIMDVVCCIVQYCKPGVESDFHVDETCTSILICVSNIAPIFQILFVLI